MNFKDMIVSLKEGGSWYNITKNGSPTPLNIRGRRDAEEIAKNQKKKKKTILKDVKKTGPIEVTKKDEKRPSVKSMVNKYKAVRIKKD